MAKLMVEPRRILEGGVVGRRHGRGCSSSGHWGCGRGRAERGEATGHRTGRRTVALRGCFWVARPGKAAGTTVEQAVGARLGARRVCGRVMETHRLRAHSRCEECVQRACMRRVERVRAGRWRLEEARAEVLLLAVRPPISTTDTPLWVAQLEDVPRPGTAAGKGVCSVAMATSRAVCLQ